MSENACAYVVCSVCVHVVCLVDMMLRSFLWIPNRGLAT